MSGTIKGVLIAGFAINTLGCANQDLPSISQILPRPKSAADTTFNAAQAQEKLGRVAEARRAYQKLYDEDPENADVCHRLAIVCAKMGDARLSHRHFLEAIRLAPDNAQIIADYGYAKLLDRDLASAETLLRKAISMQPGNKRARNNLALVRKRRKHRDQIGKTQSQRLAAKSGKTAKKTAPPKKRLAQTTPRTKTLT
ncbi:MAG: tetratricopeptide repeat protein, partial [Planctomycetaceae bacterium]